MKKSVNKFLAIAAVTLATGFVNVSVAEAGQFKFFGSKIEMAYAPQDNNADDRFDQFESEEEMHDLNDAWLGMPAVSRDGKMMGFVEDAILDENGYVTELLVSLSDEKIAVFVDGNLAELNDVNVSIDLSASAIAKLERDTEIDMASRQ